MKDNREDIPGELTRDMKINGRYPGVFDVKTGDVYLIRNEIKYIDEVEKVFYHEILGHRGIRALKKEKLNYFLDEIYHMMPKKDQLIYTVKFNGDKRLAAEEYIADHAEHYRVPAIWEKIVAVFRNCLRNWGFSIPFSDLDIRHVLTQGKQNLEKEVTNKLSELHTPKGVSIG